MSAFRLSDQTRLFQSERPLRLESGADLPGLQLAYRTWGRLSPRGDNAVVLCHALTGSADADDWWAPLFGPGRSLDPARDFIVCSNVLGGCYGSTGPTSLAPDGVRWGARFPRLTVRDQVRAQMRLADALGIRHIRCVIGGSMGGLQALEWALLDPQRVGAVVSIAAAARHSAWCMAWSEAQRLALAADPRYRDGAYDPADPPVAGLAAARAMAMVGYRNAAALARRFEGEHDARAPFSPADGAVQGWLRHHGDALTRRFDAHSYRVLLDAMDTHDLGRGRGGLATALAHLTQPVLVGALPSDTLYVPEDQFDLAAGLPNASLVAIDTPHGHDGFLIDAPRVDAALRRFFCERLAHPAPCPSGRPAPRRAASPFVTGGQPG